MVSFKRLWCRLNDAHDVGAARITAAVLLCGEMLACVLILTKVPCKSFCLHSRSITQAARRKHLLLPADTEIDWAAYMQQVQTFLQVGCAKGAQSMCALLVCPSPVVLKLFWKATCASPCAAGKSVVTNHAAKSPAAADQN